MFASVNTKARSQKVHANWTNEIFTVHAVKFTVPVTYHLKDHAGEVVKGGF